MAGDNSVCPTTRRFDFLFVLDFASRYVVDRCGAPEGVDTGIMALFAIAPLWIWVIAWVTRVLVGTSEAKIFQRGFTLITILQMGMLFYFQRAPPMPSCGPRSAFPCPQATLATYVLFADMWRPPTGGGAIPSWLAHCNTAASMSVLVSVVALGLADGPAILAGCILGVAVGATLMWPPCSTWQWVGGPHCP
jgi:hypothetical protein